MATKETNIHMTSTSSNADNFLASPGQNDKDAQNFRRRHKPSYTTMETNKNFAEIFSNKLLSAPKDPNVDEDSDKTILAANIPLTFPAKKSMFSKIMPPKQPSIDAHLDQKFISVKPMNKILGARENFHPDLTEILTTFDSPATTIDKGKSQIAEAKIPIFSKLMNENFQNLVLTPNLSDERLTKHLRSIHVGLKICKERTEIPAYSTLFGRQVTLPGSESPPISKMKRHTLLLDLDETLVHVCGEYDKPNKSTVLMLNKQKVFFKVRPYLEEFLSAMSSIFEVVIFTAASFDYAEAVAKVVDPKNIYISYILDRSFCTITENGLVVKDLRIIRNRELSSMVLVDNLVHSFAFQMDNGIPILEWYGESNDSELKYLELYLRRLAKTNNIPDFNRRMLRLSEFFRVAIDELAPQIETENENE